MEVIDEDLQRFTDKELLDFAFGGLMNNLKGLKLVRKSAWRGKNKSGYSYREVFVYDKVTNKYYRYYLSRIKGMVNYKYEIIKRPEVSEPTIVIEPSNRRLRDEFTLKASLREFDFYDLVDLILDILYFFLN